MLTAKEAMSSNSEKPASWMIGILLPGGFSCLHSCVLIFSLMSYISPGRWTWSLKFLLFFNPTGSVPFRQTHYPPPLISVLSIRFNKEIHFFDGPEFLHKSLPYLSIWSVSSWSVFAIEHRRLIRSKISFQPLEFNGSR